VTNPKDGKVVPLRPVHEDEDEQEFNALQRHKPNSKSKLKLKPKRGLKSAAQPNRKEFNPFARVPLAWAARAAIAMNCPRAFVLIWLQYQAWRRQSLRIAVPNETLARYGIDRMTKSRALRRLAEGGLINLEQHPRKTPFATLIEPPESVTDTIQSCNRYDTDM
jgi:hypothetical protein